MESSVREILEREFEPGLIKKRKGRGGRAEGHHKPHL